ncbi:hypothetical protein SIN8267_02137 [Sinobacterium norvegicum]|uniref:Transport permease protein n=1 Tax=Sinobacterium norvegicum TaxID=1641715 RepID=A0ABN8EKV7_9GAMM|nr:ABC transporter permease [Sinobacterium norvegicum]CAH0992022.1 hypothetical protein SIN8267_02137 [Sinobacterium norvegicum]
MSGMLKDLWRYRQFIISSIRNELKGKFAASKLGGLWIVLNPLSQVLIYALILSNVLAAKLPEITNTYGYAIYLMAGLLAWNLFSEIIGNFLNLFISRGGLMKKVSFPKITLPIITVGSSLLNNLLLFFCMLIIFALLGQQFSSAMLYLIPLMLSVVVLAASLGLILGVMNVFLRDIGQLVPVVLQVWFWLTPIVYPASIIPEKYMHLMELNPMYPIVTGYHDILVYNSAPQLGESIILVAAVSLAALLLSLFMFRRASAEMMDVL